MHAGLHSESYLAGGVCESSTSVELCGAGGRGSVAPLDELNSLRDGCELVHYFDKAIIDSVAESTLQPSNGNTSFVGATKCISNSIS